MTWHDLVVDVLNLVDVTLTANLVLIVIFAGYQNFIRKISSRQHDALPGGLTDVDFSALKQRLLGSVVVIAAVDALAWYLDLEKYTDTSKLGWAVAFPLMLVLALLMLAARRPADAPRSIGETSDFFGVSARPSRGPGGLFIFRKARSRVVRDC